MIVCSDNAPSGWPSCGGPDLELPLTPALPRRFLPCIVRQLVHDLSFASDLLHKIAEATGLLAATSSCLNQAVRTGFILDQSE